MELDRALGSVSSWVSPPPWTSSLSTIPSTWNDRVTALGGSISAEHGLGVAKRDAAARYLDPVELSLMRAVKDALDPRGLMNPGKLLPG